MYDPFYKNLVELFDAETASVLTNVLTTAANVENVEDALRNQTNLFLTINTFQSGAMVREQQLSHKMDQRGYQIIVEKRGDSKLTESDKDRLFAIDEEYTVLFQEHTKQVARVKFFEGFKESLRQRLDSLVQLSTREKERMAFMAKDARTQ